MQLALVNEQQVAALLRPMAVDVSTQKTYTEAFDAEHVDYISVNTNTLNQSELQALRAVLKAYIRVLADEIEACRRAAHMFREASDKDRPEETSNVYRAHQVYRKRAIDTAKTLRKFEKIQGKIRRQLSK